MGRLEKIVQDNSSGTSTQESPLIYMNYASTSPSKLQSTVDSLTDYLRTNTHISSSRNLAELDNLHHIFESRLLIAKLFDAPNPRQVVYTSGVTASLNMVIFGLLQNGDHVITTSIEHNSVARPLHLLASSGQIEVTYLPSDKFGLFDPENIKKHIKPNTKAVIMSHASNVLGTIIPIEESFKIAKEHGLITILDSAQTAGYMDISMNKLNVDVLAFTGHKSLMGLAGIGGFVSTAEVSSIISPWIVGGTGSHSNSLDQPSFMPDKFESGTQNLIGIVSLISSVKELHKIGIGNIRYQESKVREQFIDGLKPLAKKGLIKVHSIGDMERSTPVVSITSPKIDSAEFCQKLFTDHYIVTRSGLHCSPMAHQTAGTYPEGTVRFSFGYFTTKGEVESAIKAVEMICTNIA